MAVGNRCFGCGCSCNILHLEKVAIPICESCVAVIFGGMDELNAAVENMFAEFDVDELVRLGFV
jgi:hypothetical protein